MNVIKQLKTYKFLVAIALVTNTLSIYAAERVVTEEEIDQALDYINAQIKEGDVEGDYPRFTRVAIDYTKINGNISDGRDTLLGAPYQDGDSDANILRASTNIQLSKDWLAGFSISNVSGDSSISQGAGEQNNQITSDSSGYGITASLRYQIIDWLAAGGFMGWSHGDGDTSETLFGFTNTYKYSGQGLGLYLTATHAFNEEINYSISPSYTHIKSKSKYTNNTGFDNPFLTTHYTLAMWHLDQNLAYYFDESKARVTGGYTIHMVGNETESDSAARKTTTGTIYVGGSYLVAPEHGVEFYGVLTHDHGDSNYDSDSITFGIAKNF